MMKKILLILVLISITLCVWAKDQKYKDFADKIEIPLSNFITISDEMIKEDPTFVVENNLDLIKKEFDKKKNVYGGLIVVVGMLVVFLSLIVVGWIISMLKHTAERKKVISAPVKTVSTPIGKVSAPEGDLSTNSIVAVITALHLHVLEVQQQNKINMDWKRAPVSMWKSVSKAKFPNQDHSLQYRR